MTEILDPHSEAALDLVYAGTGNYLEVLADTNTDAMDILHAHDRFCREVLQNDNVMQVFRSFSNLSDAFARDFPELAENYERFALQRLVLICTPEPYLNRAETALLVGIIRTNVELLRGDYGPTFQRCVQEWIPTPSHTNSSQPHLSQPSRDS